MKWRQRVPWYLTAVALFASAPISMAVAKPPADTAVTLEQAVTQVQSTTGGKVLSADARKLGRRTQYRIKVLTPDGHVRVIVISSAVTREPASNATKNPTDRGAGTKEKH